MKIQREEVLEQLQSVRTGLSQKDIIEQSSCFAFKDGRVHTFNDEVACSRKCSLGFEGAVRSKPLLELFQKLADDVLDVTPGVGEDGAGELRITGKNRRGMLRMEAEIMLPLDAVEVPDQWRPLPAEFGEGVALVKHCAAKESSDHFCTTCIHIAPDSIEATDNYQAARFTLDTGFTSSALVRRDALSPIADLGITNVSETASWIHFQSSTGLIYSCRKYLDEFPNITSIIQGEGIKAIIPKSITQSIDMARIFSSENADDDQIRVELSAGRIKVTGRGNSGWFSEVRAATYKGPKIVFDIQPELLTGIVARHYECKIGGGALRVDSGRFLFATSLGIE